MKKTKERKLRFTQFSIKNDGTRPLNVLEIYEKIHKLIPKPRNEVYISTPLTSGGQKGSS